VTCNLTLTAVGKHWWQLKMLTWFVRRGTWDFVAWVKFRFAKPVDIKLPPAERWYIEPKPMISEFKKRSTNRDGPAITMSRSRAIFSYHVLGGGSLAMKSCD